MPNDERFDDELSAIVREGVERLNREALGRVVGDLRTERGLSVEDLADRAGVHHAYLQAIERGERNISLGTLRRLAEALGVAGSELLARVEAVRHPP